MDYAIQEQFEALSTPNLPETQPRPADQPTLNKDFQEAYKAISSSPWGAKLGGFFGSVVKQGESVYTEAQKELSAVGEEASKGLTDLRSSLLSRTRALSLNQTAGSAPRESTDGAPTDSKEVNNDGEGQDSEGVLARLRSEAAKRLTEIQKAEDAADEALLKFGTNIRNFLRDAVTIAPPSKDPANNAVMFESKDAQGKRVIHTTRFDAQLHVIHSTLDSFLQDPASEEYESWANDFNVDGKTDDISKDLEKYDELRSAMEKLVPDSVTYVDFWKRYYYLRHSIETAEARRRDLLKGAAVGAEEEVGWDDDSEDEAQETPKLKVESGRPASVDSSSTINPGRSSGSAPTLQPVEPRKSNDEKSQPDSESSYDVVNGASGVPSQAPSSPKENKKGDESEEEDWE